MSDLILHIGHTRSGSTWLQKNFFIRELGFEDMEGIAQDIFDLSYCHPLSYSPLPLKDKTERLAEKLRAENIVPVISHEAICGSASAGGYNQKTAADFIHQAFPDAKVVITIREQTSHILSAYKYFLYSGGVCNISRFLQVKHAHWLPTFKFEYYQYNHIIKYYKKLFGDDRVHVILLEQIIRKEKEAIQDLAKFCAAKSDDGRFDDDDYYSGEQVSKSNLSLMARMILNPFIRREMFNGYSYLSSGVIMKIATPFLMLLEKLSPSFIEAGISRHWKRKIAEAAKGKFSESNKELSQLIGIDLESYGYET